VRRRTLSPIVATAALMLALALMGCSAPNLTFVDEGGSYNRESALALTAAADSGDLADHSTREAGVLRHDALVDLRGEGAAGAEAASIITRTFPSDAAAVPFYVERATFDSVPALVIIEAIGPADGSLVDKRIWVLSEDGDVLLSGTR
jgi:hypothetical protein